MVSDGCCSDQFVKIFHNGSTKVMIELRVSFCGLLTCSNLWTHYKSCPIYKIRTSTYVVRFGLSFLAVYKMIVDNNVPNLKLYYRRNFFSSFCD